MRDVVPAKAGTHNHRAPFCEGRLPANAEERFCGMGPGVRRDDDGAAFYFGNSRSLM